MKRTIGIAVLFVLSMLLAFGAGYWYRDARSPLRGEMEDYALANVLGEIAYAGYLAKGDAQSLRNLIDMNLNGHLSRVVRYQGTLTEADFVASKIRTLNAAARLWDEKPPFVGLEKQSSKQAWWPGWQQMTEKNRELLLWARQRCLQDASLRCAGTPAGR